MRCVKCDAFLNSFQHLQHTCQQNEHVCVRACMCTCEHMCVYTRVYMRAHASHLLHTRASSRRKEMLSLRNSKRAGGRASSRGDLQGQGA